MSTGFKGPWILMGDFNCPRSAADMIGGKHIPPYATRDFKNCLKFSQLDDIEHIGPSVTWSNKEAGLRHIQGKLDRHLVNEEWSLAFPFSFTLTQNRWLSDHSPLICQSIKCLWVVEFPLGFLMLGQNTDFLQVVKEAWSISVQGSPMFIFTRKLKAT